MSQQTTLMIGGIGATIHWDDSQPTDWPHALYQDFVTDGRADVSLRVHCCRSLPEFEADETVFHARENGWNLHRKNGGYVLETFEAHLPKPKTLVAVLDSDLASGDVYVLPNGNPKVPTWSLPRLMQPLGELLILHHVTGHGGIMVHAVGIADQGRGLAFVGPSGAGKSTLAGLWKDREGVTVLSDEHVIIRNQGDRFWLFGTPWPGEALAVSHQAVPLERVVFISHGRHNQFSALPVVTAFNLLFAQLFLPFWDRTGLEAVTALCEELISTVDCKHLAFVKDASVIDFVRHDL